MNPKLNFIKFVKNSSLYKKLLYNISYICQDLQLLFETVLDTVFNKIQCKLSLDCGV